MKKKLGIYFLVAAPVVTFYVFAYKNAFNIGWNDDWHGIEGFLASWMQQNTFAEKIALLFSQMCEHRIIYVRLSTLLCYQLFGEANYKILMLMGVAHLLILPFVFYRLLREINLGLAYLIPLLFIIFNTQPIENIFWAITSLQPNVVIIFGLWGFSLLLFNKNKWAFYLTLVLFFIAMFTNGNGMFAFLAAIPILLYTRTKSEKIQYFVFMAFSFWLYFHDFEKPGIRPDVKVNITQYPHVIIGDFFAFFGSPIDSTVQFYNITLKHVVAITSGILLVGWLAMQLFTFLYYRFLPQASKDNSNWLYRLYIRLMQHQKFNLYLLAAFIFVGLSGAAFSVSRASQGLEQAFASRYKTVSIILFAIAYLSFFNVVAVTHWKKYLRISVVITILFSLFSYYESLDEIENHRRFFGTTILNWKNNGRYYYYAFENSRNPDDHVPINHYQRLPIPPFNYAGFVPGIMKYVNDILWVSRIHFKNYTPPAEIDSLNNALYVNQAANTGKETVKITDYSNSIQIEMDNTKIATGQRYDGYYAIFTNDKTRLAFTLQAPANKLTSFLSSGEFYNSHIDARVAKPDLPAGAYSMKIGKLENGRFKVIKEQTINIP